MARQENHPYTVCDAPIQRPATVHVDIMVGRSPYLFQVELLHRLLQCLVLHTVGSGTPCRHLVDFYVVRLKFKKSRDISRTNRHNVRSIANTSRDEVWRERQPNRCCRKWGASHENSWPFPMSFTTWCVPIKEPPAKPRREAAPNEVARAVWPATPLKLGS